MKVLVACEESQRVCDVLVVASQLRLLLGSEEIDEIAHEKIKRQLERIRKENENDGS